MSKINDIVANLFVKFTGYAYTNIGRLFLRLFVGVMFIQFGVKQLVNFNEMACTFPSVLGMGSETTLIVMIVIEVVCSLLIMVGFLTRFAVIPPLVSMVIAEDYLLSTLPVNVEVHSIHYSQPGYLPVMFIGIFFFFLLVGPGKISLDYFISLYIINRRGADEKEELEEV